MLVYTMTTEDVKKEVENDFIKYVNKKADYLSIEYTKIRKKCGINKKLDYPKFYKWISPNKNTWFFLLNKAPEFNSFKSSKNTAFTAFTYYYNNKSFRVFKTIPNMNGQGLNGLNVYNSHLFKRYSERIGLDFNKPLEVVQLFFINNRSVIGRMIRKKQTDYIVSICKEGFLLGKFSKETDTITYNTFINKSQAYENQTDIERELLENLQSEIISILNENTFTKTDKQKYNYKAGILKDLK